MKNLFLGQMLLYFFAIRDFFLFFNFLTLPLQQFHFLKESGGLGLFRSLSNTDSPCNILWVLGEVLKPEGLAPKQPLNVLLRNMRVLCFCSDFQVEEVSGERKERTKQGQLVSCESCTLRML